MFCEQCGNEFYKSKYFTKDGKNVVKCPFCGYVNEVEYKKKKKNKNRNTPRGDY